MRRSLLVPVFALSVASVASAQSTPVSPGWAAYAGCWLPVAVEGSGATNDRLCVVPSGANGADLVTLRGSTVVDRTHIEADGRRNDINHQGCTGWESAAFSSDGRRLYLNGEQQCANGLKRKSSGLFALGTNGHWVSVVSVGADSGSDLRVSRYMVSGPSDSIPADIRSTIAARDLSDRTARIAARARVTTDNIIEASKFVSSAVVEGWVSELDQDFDLDDQKLIRLADAGVAPGVIDVMVAVSNPQHFAVRATGTGVTAQENPDDVERRRQRRDACVAPVFDPWGYYAYDPCDPYRRYGYYGTRQYRYGYSYGSYYDPYGYYGGGYGYQPVVVIVRGSANDPARGHGRVTKDGYQRGTAEGRPATPASSTGQSTASTSRARDPEQKSSGGSSSGSSGGSSGGGGERTATRKPPA